MQIYTISFFGHRDFSEEAKIEKHLMDFLRDFILEKECINFLIGKEGDFDFFVSSVIKRAVLQYGWGNTHFTLVLPYAKSDFYKNKEDYLNYYDDVEICAKAAAAHPKAAIQIRNREMVDRSDLVLCYVIHSKGGAYQTQKYAQKSGKKTINLAQWINEK